MNIGNIFIINDYDYKVNNINSVNNNIVNNINTVNNILILNSICKLKNFNKDLIYNLFIIDKLVDNEGVIDNEIMIEEIINTINVNLIIFKGDDKSSNIINKICFNYKIDYLYLK